MSPPGRIVVLNGAPRSGKSSVVAAIQERIDGCWMNLGVDVARTMTPRQLQPGVGLRPGVPEHAATPIVPVLYAALYDSIAAHSRLGLDVAVDVGHHDLDVLCDCARRLDGLPALLVGVRCPIEVVMERRRDSAPGLYAVAPADEPIPEPVRRWQDAVHVPGIYDLELDSSELTPEQSADAIRARLESGVPATAFPRLAANAFT